MKLRTLYEEHQLSLNQIAVMTRQPYSRVRKQLIRAGVQLRSKAVGAIMRKEAMHQNRKVRQKRRMG